MRVKKIKVNPTNKEGKAVDHAGRNITWKKEGNNVFLNTEVSRQIKAGDLTKLVVERKETKKKEKDIEVSK